MPDFHNISYSTVSGKYQYKEKPLKTSQKTRICEKHNKQKVMADISSLAMCHGDIVTT